MDLKQFQLEVYVNATEDYLLVGISLHEERLSKRSHIHGLGLKASIAYAMCRQAHWPIFIYKQMALLTTATNLSLEFRTAGIRDGSVVLDPMCGGGTILIEGAIEWPRAHFIGGDIEPQQIHLARDNINR